MEVVVSGKTEVNGVLKTEPFIVGEEIAKRRIAESYGLVWAEGLCTASKLSMPLSKRRVFDSLINIGSGPIEELAGESVETCCCVFEICPYPDSTGIGSSKVHGSVAIIAVVIARLSDIVRIDEISFDLDFQCGVIRPSCKSQQRLSNFDTLAS